MNKYPEYLLIWLVQRGSQEAFKILYDRYSLEIRRFIYLRVKGDEVEDLLSDVFINVWEYLTNPDHKITNFRALLYRITRNKIVDFYRLRREEVELEAAEKVPADVEEVIISDAEFKARLKDIEKLLDSLHPNYREVIYLRFYRDLEIKEIAEILEKKEGAVRVLIHRALAALKKGIKSGR